MPTKDTPGCFIGVSLPDKTTDFDSFATSLVRQGHIDVVEPQVNSTIFLRDLQEIHDRIDPARWKQALIEFAKEYNLKVPE